MPIDCRNDINLDFCSYFYNYILNCCTSMSLVIIYLLNCCNYSLNRSIYLVLDSILSYNCTLDRYNFALHSFELVNCSIRSSFYFFLCYNVLISYPILAFYSGQRSVSIIRWLFNMLDFFCYKCFDLGSFEVL